MLTHPGCPKSTSPKRPKESTPKHISVTMMETIDRDRIQKAERLKRKILYKEASL